jgi:hypothetical protein
MKRLLILAAIALTLSSSAFAQKSPFNVRNPHDPYVRPVEHTLDELIEARAKLIYWYVLSSSNYAWGVSVCGGEDVLTGDEYGYLTIYVYKDSLAAFKADFAKASTKNPGGSRGVDGITVVVEVIERHTKGGTTNEQPRTGAPISGKHQDRGSAVPTIRRAS